jgi:hypothetical protein
VPLRSRVEVPEAPVAARFSQHWQAPWTPQNEKGSSSLKVLSGGPSFVTVVKAADRGQFDHWPRFRWLDSSRLRCIFSQSQMGP